MFFDWEIRLGFYFLPGVGENAFLILVISRSEIIFVSSPPVGEDTCFLTVEIRLAVMYSPSGGVHRSLPPGSYVLPLMFSLNGEMYFAAVISVCTPLRGSTYIFFIAFEKY